MRLIIFSLTKIFIIKAPNSITFIYTIIRVNHDTRKEGTSEDR